MLVKICWIRSIFIRFPEILKSCEMNSMWSMNELATCLIVFGMDLKHSEWIVPSSNPNQWQFYKANSFTRFQISDLFFGSCHEVNCSVGTGLFLAHVSQVVQCGDSGTSSSFHDQLLLFSSEFQLCLGINTCRQNFKPKKYLEISNKNQGFIMPMASHSLFEFSSWMNTVLDMDSQHHREPSDCVWLHHHEII